MASYEWTQHSSYCHYLHKNQQLVQESLPKTENLKKKSQKKKFSNGFVQ